MRGAPMLSFAAMKTAAILLAGLLSPPAWSATLTLTLTDATGAPLEDAVAWLAPRGNVPLPPPRAGEVAQVDKAFVPFVTVVQSGARVSFPNRDETRHHVYSFSPAKVFEIKLYAGAASAPSIVFDKPGDVVLGCNIHDAMVGHVYVVDSAWFGKSGREGRVRLENIPQGEYDLKVWHFAQLAPVPSQGMRITGEESLDASLTVPTRPRAPRPATR